MNNRNENYWRSQLIERLKIVAYGNFYLVGSGDRVMSVNACFPSRNALVDAYILYCKLEEAVDALKLSIRAEILRDKPRVILRDESKRIVVEKEQVKYRVTVGREWIGPYGRLICRVVRKEIVSKDKLVLIIKQIVENENN